MQDRIDKPDDRRRNDAGAEPPPPAAPFDDAIWLARLRELNPWADGLEVDVRNAAFLAARKTVCLQRYEAGRDEWNRWAAAMLELQRDAETAGTWQTGKPSFGVRPANPAAHLHLALAAADFSKHGFTTNVDFAQFQFPDLAIFEGTSVGTEAEPAAASFDAAQFRGFAGFDAAQFRGAARFYDARFHSAATFDAAQFRGAAEFGEAQFRSDAWFGEAQFDGTAGFRKAQFHGAAGFGEAHFHGAVRFGKAQFHGTAGFGEAQFHGAAWFGEALFHGAARFGRAQFHGAAEFGEAQFGKITRFSGVRFCLGSHGRFANFTQASFKGPVTFKNAEFGKAAIFTSIHSQVAFSLAGTTFRQTPDFIEATFHQAPRLDDCELTGPITESQFFKGAEDDNYPDDPRPPGLLRCFALARDKDEHARLRKLRAMAADGKDHENEITFNAYEIAARRFWVDRPSSSRFWLGWLYGIVSDTGRSIARPLVAWALTILLFWGMFFFATTDLPALGHGEHCHPSYEATLSRDELADQRSRILGAPSGLALALALRNAIVLDRAEPATSRRMFGCLYGMAGRDSSAQHVIPSSVTLLSAVQSILSAVFLFLAGLGIRNIFRMKGS